MASGFQLVAAALVVGLGARQATAAVTLQQKPSREKASRAAADQGIAAQYPNDAGIGKDPRVVFADDFEGWEKDPAKFPAGTWDGASPRSRVVADKVAVDGKDVPGKNVLLLWAAKGGSSGLRKVLGNYTSPNDGKGPGYDELYVRYYQKFDSKYMPVANHGANLGGRDYTRPEARGVGQSNSTDVAAHGYFYSGLQPYQAGNDRMFWGFYSYHMDKKGPWGDHYSPAENEKKYIEMDRWYCLERRLKLNSTGPVKADGLEELWVDGELVLHREGLRFRNVPQVKISYFSLEVYYHGLPERYTPEDPIKVYFDHLVVAKERVGCIFAGAPRGKK